MKYAFALGLLLVVLVPLAALEGRDDRAREDTLVKFKGGIGVDPVSNVIVAAGTTTVHPNTVQGISPPGQIWRIADLTADVSLEGRIRVEGRGLLLAGGNGIGTNANQSVFATLFCSGVASSSTVSGVPLEPDGDFKIDDLLSPLPSTPCDTPVLLIRNVAGDWFAAGIEDIDSE